VASAGPYASLHLTPDRKPRQHPTTQVFTGRMPFLPPNQQRQSTEGHTARAMIKAIKIKLIKCKLMPFVCTLDETLLLATFIEFFQFQTFTIMSCSVPTDSMYLRFGANACTKISNMLADLDSSQTETNVNFKTHNLKFAKTIKKNK